MVRTSTAAPTSHVVAALNVSAPAHRVSLDVLRRRFFSVIKRAASDVQATLP
jgi:hypothetical protein